MDSQRIGVVLLYWHNSEEVIAAIDRIAAWSDRDLRVYIVHNGSQVPLTIEAPKDHLCEIITLSVNRGYGGGNNAGISRALEDVCDLILLLNADAHLTGTQLDDLAHSLISDDQMAAIGPCLEEGDRIDAGGRDMAFFQQTRIEVSEARTLTSGSHFEPAYIPGTVFLCKGPVFKEIGLLDERYFFGGEIADFCRRILDQKMRIAIDLDVLARHVPNSDPRHKQTIYPYYNIRNRFLYAGKHHRDHLFTLRLKWIIIALRHMVGAALLGKVSRTRAIVLGLSHGLINRYGNGNDQFI